MWSFVVLVLAVASTVQGICPGGGGCSLAPTSFYSELGCEPVFAKSEDCCPSHYNCAEIEGRAVDKCFVQGNVYNDGDEIEESLTVPNCLIGCSCKKGYGQGILCAHIDCPEFLGAFPLGPGCYYAYNLNDCCRNKTVCPPFDDKLAKCEYDGKTYKEGEQFYSNDDKIKCVCKEGWKGNLEAPFCTKVRCGIELTSPENFKRKCAPVFYGSKDGCPIGWECPQKADSIVPKSNGSPSELKCNYGDKKMNIGDKLKLNRPEYEPKKECECKIPPLVTCIEETNH